MSASAPAHKWNSGCGKVIFVGHTLLEKIVKERVGQTLVGTVNVAVDKLAEEIAREALADETFRRALREFVRPMALVPEGSAAFAEAFFSPIG